MLASLLGCGLRRSKLVHLTIEHLQQREEHWVLVDLVGKGGHVRTVPVPLWVKEAIDKWSVAANIRNGKLFRCVNKTGSIWEPEHHRKGCLVHGSGVRLKGQY
jgi:site-specific recombinase XerC